MIGKTLGEYEVVEKIGAGGMGEVYRARDAKLKRDVALKVLPGAFVADEERMARFKREARTLASLNHTNIAALYDLAEDAGQPYLIMELVEGEDLAQRLELGALPLDDVLDIARQVADGLEEAHEKGVVHRDLKPANIKITPDGKAKILDFGLARAYLGETVDEGEMENSPTITAAMTQKGMILGTAAYMSPEQARGKTVDRRADLWSFGVILWEMLTGKRLFEGETVSDTLAAVLRAEPDWDELPADTPVALRRLMERCLERNPRKRLRDIGEARVRLERWRDDPGSMHESMIAGDSMLQPAPAPGKSWIPWALAGALLLAAAWGWFRPGPQEQGGTVWVKLQMEGEDLLTDNMGGGIFLSPQGDLTASILPAGIRINRLDRPETHLLPGTQNARLVCFSPDGQWLAYWQENSLKRIGVNGGAPVDICDVATCRGMTWVDRKTLVVTKSIDTGLTVVSLDTGEERELTTLDYDGGERSHRWPRAVPGGEYVLVMVQYLGKNYEDSDIELVSLKDGTRTTIFQGGAYPQFAPSGHLLFARDRSLFAVPYTPGSAKAEGLPVPVLENLLTSVVNQEIDDGSAAYNVAACGALLYRLGAKTESGDSRLAWLDLGTGQVTAFGEAAPRVSPLLSPDGKSLAVCKGPVDAKSIYIVDLDSEIERRLTFKTSDQLGCWSRDSRYLYWSRAEQDGRSVYRQLADGSQPEELLQSFGSSYFSPSDVTVDGKWLIGTQWKVGKGFDVMMMSLEDPAAKVVGLVEGPGNEFAGPMSPDGKWLPYADILGGTPLLHLMPFPATGAHWQLTGNLGAYHGLSWLEDMSAIIIRNDVGLHRVELGFRNGTPLISPPSLIREENYLRQTGFRSFDVLPDGSQAVVLEPAEGPGGESLRSVVYVSDWLPSLEEKVRSAQ